MMAQGGGGECGARQKKNVAAYMRMSTDRQAGSIPNQRLSLEQYARHHRMIIVKEYVDEGKSGLTIRQRSGLLSLIHDVTGGQVDYDAVLVHDVTRWGRFFDLDESAHYEFVCKDAGIAVIYVAEQFDNDGSLASAILKTISRAKAAEDIRVLSAKVLAGQFRLARQGFKQGGPAGYGLRRASVQKNGQIRRILENGERKCAPTDRVMLVPGPDHEVEVVRRIFEWYVSGKFEDTVISRFLNNEGIPSEYGRPWTPPMVNRLLTSEKYIGTAIYNRTTQRLHTVARPNPDSAWIRKRNAFPALVEPEIFQCAQELRRTRSRLIPREHLLDMLRMVYFEKGQISTDIINSDPRLPSITTFTNRFQSLTAACELAGVGMHARGARYVDFYRKTEKVRREVFLQVCECAIAAGASIEPADRRNALVLNGQLQVGIQVSRAEYFKGPRRWCRWYVPLPQQTVFEIAALLEPSGDAVRAVYLFPSAAMGHRTVLMREERLDEFSDFRFDSLEGMFGL